MRVYLSVETRHSKYQIIKQHRKIMLIFKNVKHKQK